MLISIETSHLCLASRRRFIYGFKIFLSINSVYIRKFDFFKEIVNFKNVKHDISQTRNIETIGNLTVDRCRLLLR